MFMSLDVRLHSTSLDPSIWLRVTPVRLVYIKTPAAATRLQHDASIVVAATTGSTISPHALLIELPRHI
jgi:hypothetical protein